MSLSSAHWSVILLLPRGTRSGYHKAVACEVWPEPLPAPAGKTVSNPFVLGSD